MLQPNNLPILDPKRTTVPVVARRAVAPRLNRAARRAARWAARRFNKHLATLPAKLQRVREQRLQQNLVNQRVQKLAALFVQRMELDYVHPEPEQVSEHIAQKRQLTHEINKLRRTIPIGQVNQLVALVEKEKEKRGAPSAIVLAS